MWSSNRVFTIAFRIVRRLCFQVGAFTATSESECEYKSVFGE